MKPKKRKAGRPKLPKGEVQNVIAIRLTDAEKREYEERASQQGLRLSDWIRQALQERGASKGKSMRYKGYDILIIPYDGKYRYKILKQGSRTVWNPEIDSDSQTESVKHAKELIDGIPEMIPIG
jgi:hypothetical protein